MNSEKRKRTHHIDSNVWTTISLKYENYYLLTKKKNWGKKRPPSNEWMNERKIYIV